MYIILMWLIDCHCIYIYIQDYENVLFTLPLIIRNNGELEELYNKTCNLLMKIHERRSPSEALKTFVTKNWFVKNLITMLLIVF